MADNTQESILRVNIRDINPLEHITSDLAKSRSNYEAILNGLVTWNATDNPNVTVRLATDNYPYFVDYTFPSRSAFMASGSTFAADGLPSGTFDYDNMLDMVATTSDEVTLRLTVADKNRGTWTLFEDAIVYDEPSTTATRPYVSGQFLRIPNGDTGTRKVCVVTAAIPVNAAINSSNTRPAVTMWNVNEYASYDDYPGLVTMERYTRTDKEHLWAYVLRGKTNSKAPSQFGSNWERIAEAIETKEDGTLFDKGMVYIYSTQADYSDAALYMYIGKIPKTKNADYPGIPVDSQGNLQEDWYGPLMLVPVAEVTGSTVVHHVPTTDINGFLLRSNSHEVSSVNAIANLAVMEGESEPHKGLKIFSTCNYSQWPENSSSVWLTGTDYSNSSSYNAKMVFHHASDDVKMCNIINYDGPDLDNGLTIYLPVNDLITGTNGEPAYSEPQDGAVFEFLFRIWPNAEYNGASSADLIINKAQIYVCSVKRSNELDNARVLAKFSMARLTNFYLWAENVAVPNRPVFYKAKFIYSRELKDWRTYDYYQIPDHMFLSPKGFVDPSVRNDSAGGDSYGNDGPFSGVQTAGFPLMQDPFGGLNMHAIRLNRIEHNEE